MGILLTMVNFVNELRQEKDSLYRCFSSKFRLYFITGGFDLPDKIKLLITRILLI